jgi:adenylate cyclase
MTTSWKSIANHAVLLGCFLGAIGLGWFDALERKALDQRFKLRGKGVISPDIVLVDISSDATEEFGPWPIPRHLHGLFIDAATNLGARAIVYDVSFTRPTETKSDQFLLEMAASAGNVHFPLMFSPYREAFLPDTVDFAALLRRSPLDQGSDGKTLEMAGLVALPLPGLDAAAKSMGFVNVWQDKDGMVRRTPLHLRCAGRRYPQLVVPVWEEWAGPSVAPPPLDQDRNLLINWPGAWQELPHWSFREILVSYKQVMEGKEPILPLDSLRKLKNKILLVGHVNLSSQEFIPTPLDPHFPNRGIHFAILNTLLTDAAVTTIPRHQEMLVMAGFFLVALLLLRGDATGRQIATGALFAIYLAASQWIFARHHLHLPTLAVGLSLAMLVSLRNFGNFRRERENRDRIKRIFAKYVTSEVMEQILERPELGELGGRKEVVTVLFADIRGFTSLAESLEPQEVVEQLNEYLQTMTPIIFANHGTIDKFVGDEIMAYFGAPVYPEEHAWRAVKTALEMQAALDALRRKWRLARRADIRIGIGVNTGSVVMGNIGSSQYMDFTLIGDVVNVASRLCSIAEPGEVLLGTATLAQVADRVSVVRSRETTIKGRVHPVTVHSVAAKESNEFPRA